MGFFSKKKKYECDMCGKETTKPVLFHNPYDYKGVDRPAYLCSNACKERIALKLY